MSNVITEIFILVPDFTVFLEKIKWLWTLVRDVNLLTRVDTILITS